jgi:hypothetical protein
MNAFQVMTIKLILQRIVFWSLVIFFSTITALKLLYSWFRKRGHYFYTNPHEKPAALNEWTDGYLQLSVGNFHLLVKATVFQDVKLHYVEAGDKDRPLMV